MKYLKKYEENTNEPQIGDYVIVQIDLKIYHHKDAVNNFINNNIGRIVGMFEDTIKVQYENAPIEVKIWSTFNGTRTFDKNRIVDFDKSKEKLKLRLEANKYNI